MIASLTLEFPAASTEGSALTRLGATAASAPRALQENAVRGTSMSASPTPATLEGAWTASS